MRRLKSCLVLLLFLNALFAAALRDATTVSSTNVSTEPPGARFDGQTYSSSNSFLWPAGSKHTVSIPMSQQPTSAKDAVQLQRLDGFDGFILGQRQSTHHHSRPGHHLLPRQGDGATRDVIELFFLRECRSFSLRRLSENHLR